MFWYFQNENNEFDELFPKIKAKEFKSLPIIEIPLAQQKTFVEIGTKMIEYNKSLASLVARLPKLLQSKYPQIQSNKKINNWQAGSYADFLKEIKRQKVAWSLREESEWMDYFGQEQAAVQVVQAEIRATDAEIDRLVYALYGLTAAEIAVVEQ